jgi:hypothetical protein
MSNPIKSLNHQEIKRILNRTDHRVVFEKTNIIPDEGELFEELKAYVDYESIGTKAVLGVDIYQYSTYGEFEQTLIPFLFKTILRTTIDACLANHRYIFQKYSAEMIEDRFISTGDGGFFIFDTPLHALLFACNFSVVLRIYNAFHFYPRLRKIIGGISVRFALTQDKLYSIDNNFFGRAIINNARILSKDTLNRCLMDENVYRWFTVNMDGVENLQVLTIEDIANIHEFNSNYDSSLIEKYEDEVFSKESSRRYGIINSDILKIGKIRAKETAMNIYNLHLQVMMHLVNDDDPTQTKVVTVSVGNLNTSGI